MCFIYRARYYKECSFREMLLWCSIPIIDIIVHNDRYITSPFWTASTACQCHWGPEVCLWQMLRWRRRSRSGHTGWSHMAQGSRNSFVPRLSSHLDQSVGRIHWYSREVFMQLITNQSNTINKTTKRKNQVSWHLIISPKINMLPLGVNHKRTPTRTHFYR